VSTSSAPHQGTRITREVTVTQVQILTVLLAFSIAVNIGCAAGFITLRTGVGWASAILVAGGSTGTALVIFFTAVAAYS
jgi:hypothetical protein